MTGIRGDRSRGGLLPLSMATILLLSGCATAPSPGAQPPGAQAPSASPAPTAACPQIEGVEMPPDCVPYDPDHAMAQNDRHRERMPLADDSRAAAEEAAEAARPGLEALRASGELSGDAVGKVLTDAGLTSPYVRGDYRGVLFGAEGPEGGCVFGEVSADAVTIEAGGYIRDGGCLPAN